MNDNLFNLVQTMNNVLTDDEWNELVQLIISQDRERSDHPHIAEGDDMSIHR